MNTQEKSDKELIEDILLSSCSGGKCLFKLDCLRFKLNGLTSHQLEMAPYNNKDCDYFLHNQQTKLDI